MPCIGITQIQGDLKVEGLAHLGRCGVDQLLAHIQIAQAKFVAGDHRVSEQNTIQSCHSSLSSIAVLHCFIVDFRSDGEPRTILVSQKFFNRVGSTIGQALDDDGLVCIHSEGSGVLAVLSGPGQALGAVDEVKQIFIVHPEHRIFVNISGRQIDGDLEVEGLAHLGRCGIDQLLAHIQITQLHIGGNHCVGKQNGIQLCNGACCGVAVLGGFIAHLGGDGEPLTLFCRQNLFHSVSGTVGNALNNNGLVCIHGKVGSVLAVDVDPAELLGTADLVHQVSFIHPGCTVFQCIGITQIQGDLKVKGLAHLGRCGIDQLLAHIQVAQLHIGGDHGVGEQNSVLSSHRAVGGITILCRLVIHLGGNGEPFTVFRSQDLFHGVGSALGDALNGDGLVGIHGEGGGVFAALFAPIQLFSAADLAKQIFLGHPGGAVGFGIRSGQIQGDLEVKGLSHLGRCGVDQLLADSQFSQLHLTGDHGVGKHNCILCSNGARNGVALPGGSVIHLGGNGKPFLILGSHHLFQGITGTQRDAVHSDGLICIQSKHSRQLVTGHGPGQGLGALQLTL